MGKLPLPGQHVDFTNGCMNRIMMDYLDLTEAQQDASRKAIEAVAEGTWRDWPWYEDPVYPGVVHTTILPALALSWRTADELPDHVQLLRLGDPASF